MKRVHVLHALHGSFLKQVTSVIDLDDILRAEVVLAVSALDFYIHEIARIGMLECWHGTRPATDSFKRFPLPIGTAVTLVGSASAGSAVEEEIRVKHSFATFQHPDKIADAVRLFSSIELWKEVAVKLGTDKKVVKNSLALIVDRRNKIAHEADVDPSYPGQHWPIDRRMVEGMISTIEGVVSAIHASCA